MLDLDRITSTPVTLIKKTSDKGNHLSVLQNLTLEYKGKVFSVYENKKTITYLHSFIELRYPEITSQKLIYGNEEMIDCNLYLVSFTYAINMLLENVMRKNIDFCSVLLINDIHFDHPDKTFMILLWLEMFKRSDIRPYLFLTTDCYLIPELPFNLEKISLQEIEDENKKEVDIVYHNENYSPSSSQLLNELVNVIKKLTEDYPLEDYGVSTWLVFYSGKKNISLLNKLLYEMLENVNIYSYRNINDFSKISKKGQRTIITIDEKYEDSIFLEPDGIIDSMVSEYFDENNRIFYKYSSKQSSEVKTSYMKKGFCYRLCTEELYQGLSKVELNSFDLVNLEKYALRVSSRKVDIKDFFTPLVSKNKISRTLDSLKFSGNLDPSNKITKLGKETQKLNLTITNSSILLEWRKNKEPLFPMIVFLVFTELNMSLIHFPSKNREESKKEYYERKEELIKRYYNTTYETIFELYLKIFIMIISEEKTLNIKNYNTICKKYNLNYLAVKEIFTKIKFLTHYFGKEVKIGLFDPNNLIHLSKPYLEKFYNQHLGVLSDKNKNLYVFPNSEVYRIDNYKHFNNKKLLPTKLVVFEKAKINDSEDSIQKSKNIIYYFVPIDTIYIEN